MRRDEDTARLPRSNWLRRNNPLERPLDPNQRQQLNQFQQQLNQIQDEQELNRLRDDQQLNQLRQQDQLKQLQNEQQLNQEQLHEQFNQIHQQLDELRQLRDYGINIAEIARQVGVSTSAISKSLARSYSS